MTVRLQGWNAFERIGGRAHERGLIRTRGWQTLMTRSALVVFAIVVALWRTPALAGDTPPDLTKLSADTQADWLLDATRNGTLAALTDDQLVALFKGVSAEGLAAYVEQGVDPLSEYEFEMVRQERVNMRWPEHPEHIDVRYRQSPMQIYAKWLPGGPHKGQEILYDETRKTDQMYGHLGGLLSAVSIWTSLNGAFAHTQSNHTVRDISLQYVSKRFAAEMTKFRAAGIDAPAEVEVVQDHGMRLVTLTWESPVGRPAYYAKRERLSLDLKHPWFRSVESFDNDGQIFERIVYDNVIARQFDDMTFDPHNPDYKF